MHLECTFCIKASAKCINVIAQITTPSDIGGTKRKSRPKSRHCQYARIGPLKQPDCGFIWCMKIKACFPEFCVAGAFHYVKSCFGWYSGNIPMFVLVSPSLQILLFQSEPVPGSAPLCQLLLCSSQRYFNFTPLFLSCTSWKMIIKTLSQCTPAVRNQKAPIRCPETAQLLMRRRRSHASNAEHLARRSFEENAKWILRHFLVITPQVL